MKFLMKLTVEMYSSIYCALSVIISKTQVNNAPLAFFFFFFPQGILHLQIEGKKLKSLSFKEQGVWYSFTGFFYLPVAKDDKAHNRWFTSESRC